ncbi:acyltransferase [Marinomonas sp. SBI22]|uniref:acyltransferase n=1 Tax=unclassified Marinomonas TaxID=196814 RepID=UPI0007AF8188|nr:MULTISPECIES: acyltransferase [unclassified Marinomonas]KZM41564.1 acyltransferase [Marinomonas sp. SBI22]KZM43400.1 acyltransferase [Marinomonas sp. SBI8L]
MSHISFHLKASLSLLLIVLNTLFWFTPVVALGVIKVLIPNTWIRGKLNLIIDRMATYWIALNNLNQSLLGRTKVTRYDQERLSLNAWYMLISNHQSWVDILILQRIFNRKIPFLKFFLKQELIWVPFIGLTWWALDFPFMKRYSQAAIAKRPELKGKDIEVTRKACEKYQFSPVTVMNFLEGTRLTASKHEKQGKKFNNLLTPKAGGLAFALSVMGERLDNLLDVTLVYPNGIPSFWDYLGGKVKEVKVHIRVLPISEERIGNYLEDEDFRKAFQLWVNEIWLQKDQQIEVMLN